MILSFGQTSAKARRTNAGAASAAAASVRKERRPVVRMKTFSRAMMPKV
jgi:hypothetical protein